MRTAELNELPKYVIIDLLFRRLMRQEVLRVPTLFPTLARWRPLNSRQFNNFQFARLPREFFPCSLCSEVVGIEWLTKLDLLSGRNSQEQ